MTGTGVQEIDLFPLGTVLFPGGLLPLKIFEQRYIELTKSCLRDQRPFGVCLIREGREVGSPALPEPIGCLAHIEQWDMPQLGLFHLLARGGERFHITTTTVAPNGLISAHVEPYGMDETACVVDPACRQVLELAIQKLGADGIPGPVRLDDPAWVAYRLAELLPLNTSARQQLLEITDAGKRLQQLHAVLVKEGVISPATRPDRGAPH